LSGSEPRTCNDRVDEQRDGLRELLLHGAAILSWAALGIWWKPALSMVLAPVWMVVLVAVLPARLARRRRPR
jgi:hypothetical protein